VTGLQFQAAYTTPGGAKALRTSALRSTVAGPLWALQRILMEGYDAATAQALVATVPRYNSALAAGDAEQPGLLSDFRGINAF
jgi:hypothetical protein